MSPTVVMVLERPTQFEAPLFRHAASDPEHRLRVLYTDPDAGRPALDPEIGRRVSWESDPLGGYDHAIAPRENRAAWLRSELAARRELVIVNGYTRPHYQVAVAAARRAGSPVALRLDSVPFDEGRGARRLAKRLLFRAAVRPMFRLFFAVGSSTLAYLRELGVEPSRSALLPYPVDAAGVRRSPGAAAAARDIWRARLGTPSAAPVVLAVSKLHPRETPWDLLHAWASVADTSRWLWLVGDGPERERVERAVREGSLPRVILPGYVPYAELGDLYAAADLFVHAPRVERWGVSVGEALACNLPVVASSRVGSAHDLVTDGENGFTYASGDPSDLALKIGHALSMDRSRVAAASAEILQQWGPEAAWQSVVEATRRLAAAA